MLLVTRLSRRAVRWRVRACFACGAIAPLVTVHPACLLAQAAGGVVAGRVADSSGTPVPGATLHVGDTRTGAMTDATGRYRLSFPPGGAVVHVKRIGFTADSFAVTIAAGETATRDIVLRPAATVLTGLRITANVTQGSRAATVDAIRAAPTIESVIGAEAISALPNANAADAAARVPGVTSERAEGESEFVEVRGTESRLANVMIDGAHVPGTAQGQRNPRLDDIPSGILGSVEVSKTLTADMDADAIGGTVNLVTLTPDGAPHGTIAVEYGAITLLDKRAGSGTLTYGGRVGGDQRLGFLLSASYDVNQRTINDIEPTWASGTGAVPFYPNEFSLQADAYSRTRTGVGGGGDYRLSPNTTLYVKGLYSKFLDHGELYVFDVGNGDGAPVAMGGPRTMGLDTGATLYRLAQSLTPTDRLYSSVVGARTVWHHDTLSFRASMSGTSEDIINFRATPFNFGSPNGVATTVRYDYANPNVPLYSFPESGTAAAAQQASNFFLSGYDNDNTRSRAYAYGAQVDYATPHVKVGLKVRDEGARYTNSSYSASYVGPDQSLAPFVASFNDPGFYSAIHQLPFGPVPNDAAVQAFENAHPALFPRAIDTIANALGSFWGTEAVYSLYQMTRGDIGRFSLNGGLRAELTAGAYSGHVVLPNGGIGAQSAGQTYLDLFPSGQIKYAIDRASDVRFAVSRAIARPNYSDLAPSVSGLVGDPATIVNIGNPRLRPERAWNLDLLAERFLPGDGLLSVGTFYKRIDDFIFVHSFPGYRVPPFNDGPNYRAGQPQNGLAGTLLGLEADWSQPLEFLPGLLSGLGVDCNGTLTSSSATLPADSSGLTRTARLPRQSPSLANLALTYERGPLSARVAWAWQAASITSYGDGTSNPATGDQYFYDHSQIDASIEWTLFRHSAHCLEIEIEGLNLNNAVFGFYAGTPHQHYSFQREYYGQQFSVSVKQSL